VVTPSSSMLVRLDIRDHLSAARRKTGLRPSEVAKTKWRTFGPLKFDILLRGIAHSVCVLGLAGETGVVAEALVQVRGGTHRPGT